MWLRNTLKFGVLTLALAEIIHLVNINSGSTVHILIDTVTKLQSTNIVRVSGATHTSDGVINAINDALNQYYKS